MKVRMKSEQRRAAIVRSAIHLFAEKGFRGTTTRELAAAAGVTEPVLYQHFRAKSDLYCAIIEAKATEASGHAAELAELAKAGDDRAFFRSLGELILRRYQDDPELSRLLFFSSLERHELADLFFERIYSGFYKLVTGYIRRRVREGAFRRVNPEVAARGLIGMISYHGQAALLFPGRFSVANPSRIAWRCETSSLDGIVKGQSCRSKQGFAIWPSPWRPLLPAKRPPFCAVFQWPGLIRRLP
jgi:AcrR family transcriptional regulator